MTIIVRVLPIYKFLAANDSIGDFINKIIRSINSFEFLTRIVIVVILVRFFGVVVRFVFDDNTVLIL